MDSILLQKQVRDNAKDLQEYWKDLKEWGDEMKGKDESLRRTSANHFETPLPKNKISKISKSNSDKSEGKPIKGCDYTAWEKFDADAYCAKLDKEEDSSAESELSDEIDENILDLANSEKEKGNTFFKKQQWDQAIDCYTRAIECYAYDPIYYANRALCYLKKEKYQNAESDCTTALQLDKTYVKAYQRRAAARENLNQISEAHSDLLKVLELEPKNKESKTVLARIEKKLESIKQVKPETKEQRPISKFTLSRQKHKDSTFEQQTVNENAEKETPALGDHVIERVAPPSILNAATKAQPTEINDNKERTQILNSEIGDKKLESISNVPSISKLPNDSLLSRLNMNNIQLFQNTYKSPKTRSKKPLKRIKLIDVNLKTENYYSSSKEQKANNNLEQSKQDKLEKIDSETHITEKLETKTMEENKEELNLKDNLDTFEQLNLPIPKTAVQFYSGWKSIINSKERRKTYLQKISPIELPIIFKESLESNVFSEIIETISESFNENDTSLYDYLMGLTQVKRFGALIMFMSSKDKKCLLNIVEHLRQNNKYTEVDVNNLIKLYEL